MPFSIIEDERIQGYIILGRSKFENVGYITGCCVLDEYFEQVMELLMSYAIKYFLSKSVTFVDAWLAGNNFESRKYSSWLKRVGFVSLSLDTRMVLKVLTNESNLPVNPGYLEWWFITNIFSEGVEWRRAF